MVSTARRGRPTGFDHEAALRGAVVVFWERGYEATSLPDLLVAMGIARSSFYASFGSKRQVMLEAFDLYTREQYADMKAAVERETEPVEAIKALIDLAACTPRPRHGCLFLNTVNELASRDAELHRRARAHLGRIDKLLRSLLSAMGHPTRTAAAKSAALISLAAGAVMLRKAGEPARRITDLLQHVESLAA